MEFTHTRTVSIVAILLLLAAISQPIYTALYLAAPDVDRQIIWGLEGLLFVLLAAFAGSASAQVRFRKDEWNPLDLNEKAYSPGCNNTPFPLELLHQRVPLRQ